MAHHRTGITEDMINKAFATNMQRCAADGARYIKYTFLEVIGAKGTASLECLDSDLNVIMDSRSGATLQTCFDPLEKCAEQQRLFDIREGRTAWNKLSVILDLESGDFTRKTEMVEQTSH